MPSIDTLDSMCTGVIVFNCWWNCIWGKQHFDEKFDENNLIVFLVSEREKSFDDKIFVAVAVQAKEK